MTSEEIIFVCSLSATSISKHRRSHHKLTSLWPLSVHAPWSKSFPAESWCRLLHNKQSLENHIQPFTAGLPSLLCFLFLYRWRMWRVSISSIIDTDLCIGEWAPNVPKWQETVQKRGGISSFLLARVCNKPSGLHQWGYFCMHPCQVISLKKTHHESMCLVCFTRTRLCVCLSGAE